MVVTDWQMDVKSNSDSLLLAQGLVLALYNVIWGRKNFVCFFRLKANSKIRKVMLRNSLLSTSPRHWDIMNVRGMLTHRCLETAPFHTRFVKIFIIFWRVIHGYPLSSQKEIKYWKEITSLSSCVYSLIIAKLFIDVLTWVQSHMNVIWTFRWTFCVHSLCFNYF